MKVAVFALGIAALAPNVQAGPVAYGTCQAACATTIALGGPLAYAACQSACAALLAAPCP